MLHACLRHLSRHPLIHHRAVGFTFNSMERAYLIHWLLNIESALALGFGVGITILGMLLTTEEL